MCRKLLRQKAKIERRQQKGQDAEKEKEAFAKRYWKLYLKIDSAGLDHEDREKRRVMAAARRHAARNKSNSEGATAGGPNIAGVGGPGDGQGVEGLTERRPEQPQEERPGDGKVRGRPWQWETIIVLE